MYFYKPHGNHKEKSWNYTKEHDREVKAYWKRHQNTKKDRRKRNNGFTKQPENNKMAVASPYRSINALNIKDFNSLIKKHRIA